MTPYPAKQIQCLSLLRLSADFCWKKLAMVPARVEHSMAIAKVSLSRYAKKPASMYPPAIRL